jgi:hypothetical protein
MAGVAAANPKQQFCDAVGRPLAGGLVDVYLAGTTTRTNTWQDRDLTTLNQNPVQLDSRGECTLWLDPVAAYKLVLKNSAGVTQSTVDNVVGAVGGRFDGDVASYAAVNDRGPWAPITSYLSKDIVLQDGTWYISMVPHTSSAAFATDQATKWRVYQGVTTGDLSATSGGSIVGTAQAGTGAAARTAQDKLREFVTPEDFYLAVEADQTGMIQRACATIGVSSRGVRFNPATTYSVSDTTSITSQTSFQLHGAGRITQTASNKPIFTLTSCSDFQIHGLFFYGKGTDYVAMADTCLGDGIRLVSCTDFAIHHNTFKNFGYSAVRARSGCSNFSVHHNYIYGTNGITSAVAAGDTYQIGVIVQSGASLTAPCSKFEVSDNWITGVAIGVRAEPGSTGYKMSGNHIYDITGQHAFYLNGTVFSITGNVMWNLALTGVKLQSFNGAINEGIACATVSGNTVNGCESGYSVEKTSSLAPDATSVTIAGNTAVGVSNTGYGIYAADVLGLTVDGNTTKGGAHGVLATATTAGRGCSGRISNHHSTDTRWAAISAYAYESLSVTDNTAVRPCLAATAGANTANAFHVVSSSTIHRAQVSGNVLVTGTSTGVTGGLFAGAVDLWLGDNDLEAKPIVMSGATLRKRTPFADYTGSSALSGIGPIASGARITKTVAVTGLAKGDSVVFSSIDSDLQGCTLSCSVDAANTLTATFSNNTGASVTIANGSLRYGVMRYAI